MDKNNEGEMGTVEKKTARPQKAFPSFNLEEALKIPLAIAKNNAGNPWESKQIAIAISMGEKSSV